MTLLDLISTNNFIVDIEIDVRRIGKLVDAYYIGPGSGIVPKYPVRIGGYNGEQATYVRKSINTYDDGKDYFEIKPDRIPEKYLSMQVMSWKIRHVYYSGHKERAGSSEFERLLVDLCEPGSEQNTEQVKEKPAAKKKEKSPYDGWDNLEGQLSLFD